MRQLTTKLATLTVTLALAALPLAACGNSAGSGTASDEPSPAAAQPADVDMSSWKTMRDALSTADSNEISYSYNENYFVCVFHVGESSIRTVAKYQPSIDGAFADLDFDADDYLEKFTEVVADLELVEAQDITSDLMSQDEIAQYVGKTGQELMDEGFVFGSYSMYGGEQTGADLDRGYYSYSFTFDTKTSEEETEDGGASILDAPVVEAQSLGNLSNAALDPTAVK